MSVLKIRTSNYPKYFTGELEESKFDIKQNISFFYDSVYDYCMFKWTFSSNTIPFFLHYTDAIRKRGLCRQQAPKGEKRGGERKWMWYKKIPMIPSSLYSVSDYCSLHRFP